LTYIDADFLETETEITEITAISAAKSKMKSVYFSAKISGGG
jgi:hypothetical protein